MWLENVGPRLGSTGTSIPASLSLCSEHHVPSSYYKLPLLETPAILPALV